MEETGKIPYFFEEDVKLIAYCPICEADLNPIKGRLVENRGDLNLVHLQCPKCQGYILALIMKTANGLTSLGLITDLNFNDVNKFKDSAVITPDEVIGIYQALQQKNIAQKILELNNK